MRSPTHPSAVRAWSSILAAAALTLGAVAGCGRPVVHRGYNVVFVLVDTLRADHLASYGYERETSPFFDWLARSSVQFTHVRSQSSCTFPSANSILTSRNVFAFFDPETRPAIPESIPSLAEILKDRGYRTLAVSASPIVRNTPSQHNPRGGFGRGFDVFDEECQWLQATCVTRVALRRLGPPPAAAGPAQPFFLYLHYMDPHDPYRAMRRFRGKFARPYAGEHEFIAAGNPNPIAGLVRRGEADGALPPADFEHLIDLYDEEIYSFDFSLRRLFQGLEELGVLERSLVVVASDHGEAFFEHGQVKHCRTVYDGETRVPLVLALPRLEAPVRVSSWVQNLDVAPTLLDYLGIDAEPYGFEGESLRPVIESGARAGLAFSAMGSMRSVNDERYKLVLDFAAQTRALYDLREDPGEQRDLSGDRREDYARLLGSLKAWSDRVETGSEEERLERAREIEDELRALGYLGG